MPATPSGGKDIAGDQASGVSGNDTKHSYMFSLDEVVISAADDVNLSANLANAAVNTVVYVEGSAAQGLLL